MQTLDGLTALVTGAANGIGHGIARVLASEGARVAIVDINFAQARIAADRLVAAGKEAIAVAADVADMASMQAAADQVRQTFGGVDILAANAGIFPLIKIADLDDVAWDRVMDINVKGAVHAIRACLPSMLASGYGRIVLTSSITGPITGTPGYGAYGASKAALLGMMRSVALEVALRNITVNAVLPGNVRTEGLEAMSEAHQRQMMSSIPMKEFADPEDVGWAVRFLVSPEARYITGQTLVIDGGQVLPEAPDSMSNPS